MIDGSLAWKPQATLALVTTSSSASSSPSRHWPKPSPRSELRSIPTASLTRRVRSPGGSGGRGCHADHRAGGIAVTRLGDGNTRQRRTTGEGPEGSARCEEGLADCPSTPSGG